MRSQGTEGKGWRQRTDNASRLATNRGAPRQQRIGVPVLLPANIGPYMALAPLNTNGAGTAYALGIPALASFEMAGLDGKELRYLPPLLRHVCITFRLKWGCNLAKPALLLAPSEVR